MTTILPIISDIQYPLHDKRALSAVQNFVNDLGVDTACVGDEWDNWQTSQWMKGLKGEYDGQVSKQRDEVAQLLVDLRVKDLSRSNHTETRLDKYLAKFAPALADLPELSYEQFMRLDQNGIRFHRKPHEIAPGWLMVHGDEGSQIQTPGGTAMNIARKTGTSIVCGHTHKLGLQHHTYMHGGKVQKTLWGFETGALMDPAKASYIKGGIANWTLGFGVLVIEGKDVTPIPVTINANRSFYFDGKVYKP